KLSFSSNHEALLYAWGDSIFTADILIHDYVMPVTQNLKSALRSLRLKKDRRLL
ncbi:hypothetical protein K469DRAFT_587872, partial [Zopfia rhizophila CBS 207.26]